MMWERPDLWSEATIADLRKMFDENMSASQIGRAVGRSRCAVIGKLNRLGLHRARTKPHLSDRQRVQAIRGAVEHTAVSSMKRRRAKVRAGLETLPRLIGKPADGYRGVSIFKVKLGQCRYPINRRDGSNLFFCGAPSVPEKAWCPEHFALCTLPARSGERFALKRLSSRFA